MCLLWERIEVLIALQRRRICICELVSHDDAKLYCKGVWTKPFNANESHDIKPGGFRSD